MILLVLNHDYSLDKLRVWEGKIVNEICGWCWGEVGVEGGQLVGVSLFVKTSIPTMVVLIEKYQHHFKLPSNFLFRSKRVRKFLYFLQTDYGI